MVKEEFLSQEELLLVTICGQVTAYGQGAGHRMVIVSMLLVRVPESR